MRLALPVYQRGWADRGHNSGLVGDGNPKLSNQTKQLCDVTHSMISRGGQGQGSASLTCSADVEHRNVSLRIMGVEAGIHACWVILTIYEDDTRYIPLLNASVK